jgi:glucosylceramidase
MRPAKRCILPNNTPDRGGGDFSNDFGWHMQFVGIGSINNWSKTITEWNMATDDSYGPRTPGGCTTCQGAFTVDNSANFTKNVSYYIVGQFSKFVQAGATRIGLSGADANLAATAFRNPDGSMAVVAYNAGDGAQSVKIMKNGQGMVFPIPGKSASTFTWSEGPVVPVESIAISPSSGTLEAGQTVRLSPVFTPSDATNKSVQWNTDDFSIAPVSADGTITAQGEGQTVIYAVSVDGNYSAPYAITVTPKPIITYPGVYNIFSIYSAKGIEVVSQSMNDGANVQQMAINGEGTENQRWLIEHVEDNIYLIKAKHSALCLSTGADGQWGGKNVEQKTCNGNNTLFFPSQNTIGQLCKGSIVFNPCLDV